MVRTERSSASAEKADRKSQRLDHIELSIGGMKCPHCPPAIEKALSSIAGVASAHVNLANRLGIVDYDPEQVKISDLSRAIRAAGYVAGTAKIRIPIKNMHCTTCIVRLELALQATPGVISATASLSTNAADIEYQPEGTSFANLRAAIESGGYCIAELKLTRRRDGKLEHREKKSQVLSWSCRMNEKRRCYCA